MYTKRQWIWAPAPSRQDALCGLPFPAPAWATPGNERHQFQLSRLHPCLGPVEEREAGGAAGHGQGSVCASLTGSQGVVHQAPAPVAHGSAPTPDPVMQGHYAYYGITGNGRRLRWYHHQVERIWKSGLSRRSRSGKPNWTRMAQVLDRFPLPPTRIVHQWSRI